MMHFKRGSLYLMTAWGLTLISGYAYNFWLTHRFSQSEYGDYQVVMSILLWLEIAVINGLPYTIQKFIGSDETRADAILQTAFKLQILVAAFLFGLAFVTSSLIAGLFKSEIYTLLLRVAFCDVLFYGFYHLLLAYQNGHKRFGKQALLLVIYSFAKVAIGIFMVAWLGTLVAALIANIAASILGLLCGIIFLGKKSTKETYPYKPLIQFTLASLGFLLLLNLLFSIDLWFIKYFLPSQVSGFYAIAGMLARAPYFLFLGVATTMLPTLSSGLSEGNIDKVRQTFRQALQFLWLLMAPVGVLMVVFRHDILSTLFKPEYNSAAPLMAILVWGMIALAFFFLNTTLLNADHRPKLSLALVGATVILDVILCKLFIPRYGAAGGVLSVAAACMMGFVVSSVFVYRRFRVGLPMLSFFRISSMALGIGGVSYLSGIHGIAAIPTILAGMVVYLGCCFWIGELNRQDMMDIFGS